MSTEGKTAYGKVMYFDHSLVFASAIIGSRCSSSKEAETCEILYAVRKAINFRILKAHFYSDAKEVVKVLKRAEDWAIKSLV